MSPVRPIDNPHSLFRNELSPHPVVMITKSETGVIMPITSKLTKLVAGATLLFSTSIAMSVPSQAAPFVAVPVLKPAVGSTAQNLPVEKVQNIYRRNLGTGSARDRDVRSFNRKQRYRNYNPRRWKHRHDRHRWHRNRGSNIIGPAILGTIIGGAIANNSDRYYRSGLPAAHYRICDARYRSYRAYDNTFQPYNGPRKQCVTRYFP